MKPLTIIDTGHGGLSIKGEYTTDPKIGKKFHHDGQQLHGNGWFYEGVGNRVFGYLLASYALNEGYPVHFTAHQQYDTGLQDRVEQANNLHNELNGKCAFISCHSNAGGGEGWEIFTTVGQTESDKLATFIYEANKQRGQKFRLDESDGDPDKESNFYVIRKTNGIAVLIELGFFDNPKEVQDLQNIEWLQKAALDTWEGIKAFYRFKGWINSI